MRRVPSIAFLLTVTVVTVASCGTGTARHPDPAGQLAPVGSRHSGTGWIPPGPALPPDATPAAAPNLVYLDTQGNVEPKQALLIYRVRSLGQTIAPITVIEPPGCCNFQSVSAADDDRTFVAPAWDGSRSRFYELRLDRAGKPAPLVRLSFSVPGDIQPGGIALSPDGRGLAAVVMPRHGRPGPYRISVIATSTGRMRTWTWRGPMPTDLAWSGDRHVDFLVRPQDHPSRLVRLSTSAPGPHSAFRVLPIRLDQFGSLARWPNWSATGLTVSADGRTAFAPLIGGGDWTTGGPPRMALLRFSATTGRPLQVLFRPWAVPEGNEDYSCGMVWTDASSRHYVFTCGPPGAGVRVDDGRFTRIVVQPTPDVPSSWAVFAW